MSNTTRADTGSARKRPKPKRQKGGRAKRILKVLLFTALSLFALACVGIAIAYATIDVPTPNQLANAQASIVYYDDGKTELARLSDVNGNRESVPLSQVPQGMQKAVLAAEDRDFYTNKGVSPTGIARAIWDTVRGADTQSGGSTITQQYVKNYFLTQDRSIIRKGKEIIISVKIDQTTTKDQVLENYLNTIYFGRGAYGIKTAAKAYFGKDPQQLTVPESAVLASVINAPSLFDPALGTRQQGNLKDRFDYVLDGMVTKGWLSAADRAAITTVPPTIAPQTNRTLSGTTGYIVAAVRDELKSSLKLSDSDIDRGGLRVTTTINKVAQDAAVAAVAKDLPTSATDVYAGLAAIKPGDGAIVAMYGGADYQKRQINSATGAIMQAGSTFKPFALIAALQQGISTKTQVSGNSPFVVPNDPAAKPIPNEFKQSFGQVDLREGLAKSINTAFLRLNEQIGPQSTEDAAVAAGMPKACPAGVTTANGCTPGLNNGITNVLGTSSPHVIDVASAYATIAANGVRTTPYLIASATSDTVAISYKASKTTAQAFSADIAADTLDAMQQVTSGNGTASRAQQLGRPVAGKTGTTDGHLSVWFTGVVPQLSVSVGMFKDVGGVPQQLTNIAGLDELSGNSIPLSIWLDFMKAATANLPAAGFPARVGIGDDKINATPTTTATPSPSTSATSASAPPVTTTTTQPPVTTTTTRTPPPTTTTTSASPTPTTTKPTPTPSTTKPPAAPAG